jgi:hypothetical protein
MTAVFTVSQTIQQMTGEAAEIYRPFLVGGKSCGQELWICLEFVDAEVEVEFGLSQFKQFSTATLYHLHLTVRHHEDSRCVESSSLCS